MKPRHSVADGLRKLNTLPRCERCLRPEPTCVCDRLQPIDNSVEVLILQHPQEKDAVLGTASLLQSSLKRCRVVPGLSWRSFEHALGKKVDRERWAVVFPSSTKKGSPSSKDVCTFLDRQGHVVNSKGYKGLVLLDGSWSQVKTLWWRNPWLLKLTRVDLQPSEPSIYGSLRQEPKRHYLSTLESVAEILPVLGEPSETRTELRRLFRTVVQRTRDFVNSDGA